ncbi:adenylate kinase 2 [Drosophila tropicalis]|uniref:adenylate kinase 2 n=1 Tax=Drosophila tropicalis TaxID=46794 RepID=UPI0035AB94DB
MSFSTKFDKLPLVQFGAAFMFYVEKHKLMELMSRLLAEISIEPVDDIRRWLGENVRRISHDIYTKSLDAFHRGVSGDFYQLPRSFFHRIVLHGRPGSGRRSLAHVLGRRWDLLIIDADALAYHSINGEDQENEHVKQLQRAIEMDCVYGRSQAIGNLIQRRLLQEDALHRGWILYNYPNNSCEARELFDGFSVPPNRLIYLQIDERMARMRIISNSYTPSPQSDITYIDHQMEQYCKSEPALDSYLSHRREVIYIDAKRCFEEVKCEIMSELNKTPYVLGYKYGQPPAQI